ncbi:hypothetical protein HZH66_004122 [Vespula vulgaris]|uniref:Uncharacterized protein n=1 Tax=Vespula vulgaris TaxID=7454 RepID=A0A834KED9_VESVU|nr:hypothetical protein HZH66_004122 [Vespula vulgaris]
MSTEATATATATAIVITTATAQQGTAVIATTNVGTCVARCTTLSPAFPPILYPSPSPPPSPPLLPPSAASPLAAQPKRNEIFLTLNLLSIAFPLCVVRTLISKEDVRRGSFYVSIP